MQGVRFEKQLSQATDVSSLFSRVYFSLHPKIKTQAVLSVSWLHLNHDNTPLSL